MNLPYAYTPLIWPPLLTVVIILTLSIYAWRRRHVPGALPLAIGCWFSALWAAGSLLESAAVDPAVQIQWIKFQALWQLPATTAVTCFILEYTWPGRWLTRRNLALLAIPPLLIAVLAVTNDLHGWFWTGFNVNGAIEPLRGPAARAGITYGTGLLFINLMALGWLFVRSPQHRWPVAIMVIGQFGGRALYLMDKASILHSNLPLDILSIALVNLMYITALFSFRLFDPVRLARQAAIQQMQAGMLVLDGEGLIASLNPCAARMLGAPARQIKGRSVCEVLPPCPVEILAARGIVEVEISLPQKPERSAGAGSPGKTHPIKLPALDREQFIRHFTLIVSPLTDFRGLEVGRLLLLHDITEQKQAQAQIIEQQRALATLQEREQLARELHDNTAQVLAYANFQLQAVQNYIKIGQSALLDGQAVEASRNYAEAGNQLARLSSIIGEAHADIREDILNLRLAPSENQPFFERLAHYLDGYRRNYDIQAELTVDPGLLEESFEPNTQLQLFRIIQEALSNARKHSGARSISVNVSARDRLTCFAIRDNGCGFDPEAAGGDGSKHFGMLFMHERAELIGASLQVHSAPGQGTCVEVMVPISLTSEQ